MNTGPGGIAGFFVHDRFAEESLSERPRFAGWWGHRREDRFLMAEAFVPIPVRCAVGWRSAALAWRAAALAWRAAALA